MDSRVTRRAALGTLSGASVWAQGVARERTAPKPNVMLLAGDSANDAERSLTSIAQELESKHSVRSKLLAAYGARELPVADVLEDANLVVMYLHVLELPRGDMNAIRTYVNSGKPLVAIRTSIQAFNNWPEFGPEVLGAKWQFDYGPQSGTEVSAMAGASAHPILKGVPQGFQSSSALFHVLPLASSTTPLLMGKSTGSSERSDRVPNPVAWTRTNKGGRIFYTSLGHPEDFKAPAFRMLLVNGIQWALGR